MATPYDFSDARLDTETGITHRKASGHSNPKARLLLLHGVGSNETNLAPIAASLPADLEILLLRGPLSLGPEAFAWYEVSFTPNGPSFNQGQAEESRKRLADFIRGLPQLPTVIAGFSQGGIMSSSVGLTEPELVEGFAMLSGRMLREIAPQIATPQRLLSLSAFVAHGHQDTVLPITWAQEADDWLNRLGVAHETHLYDMAHQIIGQELQDFSAWLTATFAL